LNPGRRRGGNPATNRLSYGAACPEFYRYFKKLGMGVYFHGFYNAVVMLSFNFAAVL
jgi:hypothetical protein